MFFWIGNDIHFFYIYSSDMALHFKNGRVENWVNLNMQLH
jgi:hypothetical protein